MSLLSCKNTQIGQLYNVPESAIHIKPLNYCIFYRRFNALVFWQKLLKWSNNITNEGLSSVVHKGFISEFIYSICHKNTVFSN